MATNPLLALDDVLGSKLFEVGGKPVTPATVATIVVVLVVAIVTARAARSAVERSLTRAGVSASRARDLARVAHHVLIVVGVAVGLETAGVQLSGLFAASAIFAVGFGLAMQNIAQNFVAGLILRIERSIKPDDILEVQGQIVQVRELGLRATLVRTRDEEELIIPNATLIQTSVKNFTLHDSLYRVRVVVGLAYESDMAQAKKVLVEAARAVPWRDASREPLVLMDDFASSSVNWEVCVWTHEPWEARVAKSDLREAIWNALRDADLTISFPQVDVHFDAPVLESLRAMSRAA